MVTLRFFSWYFLQVQHRFHGYCSHSQSENDKGPSGHEGFPHLIRTCCISAGFVSNALRVMHSLFPCQGLAVSAPREVFHKLNFCGVTQLQDGLWPIEIFPLMEFSLWCDYTLQQTHILKFSFQVNLAVCCLLWENLSANEVKIWIHRHGERSFLCCLLHSQACINQSLFLYGSFCK